MTDHVIREESNHVLLPRLGGPMPPPTPAQREALRLLRLGRTWKMLARPSVQVVDTKARTWTVSAGIIGGGKTDGIAAIHAELLARVSEEDE